MKTIKEWKEEHKVEDLTKWLPLETEQSKERLKICGGCPSFDSVSGNCSECSCYIPVKCRFFFLSCPLNKWEDKQ